jgi:Flp pilus assembly pilin Flp
MSTAKSYRYLPFPPPNVRFGYLWRDDSGRDLAEDALLVALIAVLAISGLYIIGGDRNDVLKGVGNELETGFAST